MFISKSNKYFIQKCAADSESASFAEVQHLLILHLDSEPLKNPTVGRAKVLSIFPNRLGAHINLYQYYTRSPHDRQYCPPVKKQRRLTCVFELAYGKYMNETNENGFFDEPPIDDGDTNPLVPISDTGPLPELEDPNPPKELQHLLGTIVTATEIGRQKDGTPKTHNEDVVMGGGNTLVIGDGMGGHNAGHEAASSVVTHVYNVLSRDAINRHEHIRVITEPLTAEERRRVKKSAEQDPESSGRPQRAELRDPLEGFTDDRNTTLTAFKVVEHVDNTLKAHIIHRGDSRLYAVTKDDEGKLSLRRLTMDEGIASVMFRHNPRVQKQVETYLDTAGTIDELRSHAAEYEELLQTNGYGAFLEGDNPLTLERLWVTRNTSAGYTDFSDRPMNPEEIDLTPDVVALWATTDGITDELTPDMIESVFNDHADDLTAVPQAMIDKTNDAPQFRKKVPADDKTNGLWIRGTGQP